MSFTRATFNEVLDDLSCRFLINIPEEEGISAERIGFQIEEAHWFYEDFVREQNSSLPGLTLKAFSNRMFQHCPLLHKWSHDHEKYYNDFLTYKLLVPVCGAIILNPTLDKCLFVRGYNSKASWGFPKGKVDLEEDDHFCAIREIKEEVGFDIEPYLVKKDCISQNLKGQRVRLYIVPCIPESVSFQTQTRKEIGRICWLPLSIFPKYTAVEPSSVTGDTKISKFYNVHQFIPDLNRWVEKYKKTNRYVNDYNRASTMLETPLKPLSEKQAAKKTPKSAKAKGKVTKDQSWTNFHFNVVEIMNSYNQAIHKQAG
ncbi:mRNA-decapping enzyme subunit 2 [Entomophthora muscae]|uniref:mRNA-decapping enzyme subunit 2 n=2 Tax=Entomophthora muscae TaxID=34485 RepID=A0ACC2SGX8_9FUNG|nr:mRNA-decapping enzyme subunit 2 [Entomophthora muscae]